MFTEIVSLLTRFTVAVEKIANTTPVASAPAAEKPKAPRAPAATKAPVTPPPPPVEAPPAEDDLMGGDETVTIDMLKSIVPLILAKVDKAEVKKIIETVGNAANISAIDPKNYGAVHAAFKKLL